MDQNEEKKEYLRRYLKSVAAVKRYEDEIKALRMDKMYPSNIITDMPSSHSIRDLSAYAVQVEEVVDKLLKKRYEKIKIYVDIFEHIELLEKEEEKIVLTLRYIKGLSWEDAQKKMGTKYNLYYDIRSIQRIHGRALNNIQIN